MGIDIDCKLVIGAMFSFEDMKQVLLGYEIVESDFDDQREAVELFYEKAHAEFPSLFFGDVSPYFDCDIRECIFYVSLHETDNTDVAFDHVEEAKKECSDAYHSFFQRVKVPLVEPRIIALPHVC